jgi:hypothetical protein
MTPNQQLLVDAIKKMIWFSQLVLQEQERPILARYQGSKRKTGKTYYTYTAWRESWFLWRYERKIDPYMQPLYDAF